MRDSFTEERPAPVMGKFRGVLISPDVFVIDASTVRGKKKKNAPVNLALLKIAQGTRSETPVMFAEV